MEKTMQQAPFHLAFPVADLEATRQFYAGLLECPTGRESETWIDFDFFGNQITAHRVVAVEELPADAGANPVDGDRVPVPHFGAILSWDHFHLLAARLERARVSWIIPPRVRFQGQVGEQATMFLRDPSGHALEFKSFRDPEQTFRAK